MSERIVCFCDFCNTQEKRTEDGRGYAECSEDSAVRNLGWTYVGDSVMCVTCQEENGIA